ncbi:S41 family peptidase [bacterium]|nr:S41 family peptidase [bacterium]
MKRLNLVAALLAFGLWGCSAPSPIRSVSAEEAPKPAARIALPAHALESALQLAEEAQPDPPKRKKARNGDVEDIKRSYAEYIKEPKKLEFIATDDLYRNIYFHARQSFVQDVPEAQLTAGIVKELDNFLTQAKVDHPTLKEQLESVKPVDAFNKAQALYGDKVDKSLLGYATMNGMLEGLKDNYSVLMTPAEWGKMDEQLNSKTFGGIGVYIELDREAGNQLTIFEPIEGTPAYNAGLLSGDKVLKIDGKTTAGVTLDVAQTMIRGEAGTPVVLTVERDKEVKDFTVTRGQIHTVTVTSRIFPGNVGYIRLRAFGQDTGQEIAQAIAKLKAQGAKGLILDLRNNGGGYIDASVDVVGEFAPNNSLVVYTIDRAGKRKEYRSHHEGGIGIPAVVMINEYSASASEITAGALRDHKLATVVGDHSFGKGSVQQLYNLDLAAEKSPKLKLTIARFYTPGGSVIDRQGIEPQVSVDMETRYVGKVDKDVQLQKAVELLGGSIK